MNYSIKKITGNDIPFYSNGIRERGSNCYDNGRTTFWVICVHNHPEYKEGEEEFAYYFRTKKFTQAFADWMNANNIDINEGDVEMAFYADPANAKFI